MLREPADDPGQTVTCGPDQPHFGPKRASASRRRLRPRALALCEVVLALLLPPSEMSCSREAVGPGEGTDAGEPGPNPIPCIAGVCPGCCTAEGTCVSGTEDRACGLGGLPCADCAALSGHCEQGQCRNTEPCGPDTCSGCCDQDGNCLAGVAASACGRGGVACRDCGDLVCRAGTCVPGCHDEDGDGYGPGCALGDDCNDRAPGVTGPCQDNGCPQGWAYVPAGEFLMGCVQRTDSNNDQLCGFDWAPWLSYEAHEEYVGGFCIQKLEVSVADYEACAAQGYCLELRPEEAVWQSCNWHGEAGEERPNHPMNCLTWRQMRAYCENWVGGDLPTEAEWEKAARGTDGRIVPWGNDPYWLCGGLPEGCEKANIYYCGWPEKPRINFLSCEKDYEDYPFTWEVGHLGDEWDSPYGLKDVLGNVSEATLTSWRPKAVPVDETDDASKTVARGFSGSCEFGCPTLEMRARFITVDRQTDPAVGFRCVRRLDGSEAK